MTAAFPQPEESDAPQLDVVVGYLNFSSGAIEPRFLENLNELCRSIEARGGPVVETLARWLLDSVDRLQSGGGAFSDAEQAKAVVDLLVKDLLPTYRDFHRDLLHHQQSEDLWRPFFLGRAFEALLLQGGPWHETQRIVGGAVGHLNDYVGYRPTPMLTSGNRSDPYAHEFVRPIPLYIRGAGVATGRYEALLSMALEILRDADQDILARAWFDLDRLEEIALDPRAYDFDHPVNRRPNHHFGQWDPRHIDASGFYTRFVIQQITLDALLTRCECDDCPAEQADERLYEAAAVLAGTMLMASGTSGDSPGRHDSTVTLSTLLPHIAAYRDDFYDQLLKNAAEPRRTRLLQEAEQQRQPFGAARQHLNHELARRRALQLQRVHLALLFARMGRPEAALRQASSVRVASARMLTAVYCRLTAGHDAIDRDDLQAVGDDLTKIEELLHRAIECGALVDPWSIVGFAANYSLFPALENTVHDWRVDELIELIEQILDLAARAWSEAAAVDNTGQEERFKSVLERLSRWWDQFATSTVEGVAPLRAKEIEVSANLVAGALNAWHKAGAASGDVAFWRMFVDQFDSSKAFQLVIEALLDHGDTIASQALMMQWVNQRDRTPLDDGEVSLRPLAFRWLTTVEQQQLDDGGSRWPQVAKFFAYLEANAEEYWDAPELALATRGAARANYEETPYDGPAVEDEFDEESLKSRGEDADDLLFDEIDVDDLDVGDLDDDELDDDLDGDLDDIDLNGDEVNGALDPEAEAAYDYEYDYDEAGDSELSEEDELFGAAYEEMVYRDTTDDGVEGDLADEGFDPIYTQWELEIDRLEQRLSFLNMVARLWKHAAITWGAESETNGQRREVLDGWLGQAARNYRRLIDLLESVHGYRFAAPSSSHDSLIEFDRLRTVKEQLIQLIVGTCVETAAAARLLMATRAAPASGEEVAFDKAIDVASVPVLRAALTGDGEQVRRVWPRFLAVVETRPLLYVPHSRGGKPRTIVATRGLQRLLHDLLGWLPQLGLVRETCELLDLAQRLETENSVGPGAVTEFDRLFENGYQAVVRSMVASAEAWDDRIQEEQVRQADHMLVDVLQLLTERQLDRWLSHSRTLRLSIVEKLSDDALWAQFVEFVKRYGSELFTQRFLSLGNLRGILHQGVDAWITKLEEDPEMVEDSQFLTDLEQGASRELATELMSIALETVVENYRAYRDYNTTTTQSDHGELLYMFVDFLRLRAAYDRVAWNLKPVVWAHEILVRHGRVVAAEMWRHAFAERTHEVADVHQKELARLSELYGMQLPTISDRLDERFIRPLIIDQVCALVCPAMSGDQEDRDLAFGALEEEIAELAAQPHGAGLDVPDWLAALEDEVTEARSRLTHVSSSERLASRIGQVALSWSEIFEQLSDEETDEQSDEKTAEEPGDG